MKPTILLYKKSNGSGGSGIGWQGQVEFRANLPITLGTPAVGEVYLVEKPTTILLGAYTTYQSGLYIRDTNNGNLNDWRKLNVKTQFTDSEWALVQAADNSKRSRFDLSLLTTATTRIYQLQDKDGIIAHLDDIPTGDALYLVKTSASDSTPGYLNDELPDTQDLFKLVGPPPPGGDEKVTFLLREYNKPFVSVNDPTENDDNSVAFRHRIGQNYVSIQTQKVFSALDLSTGSAVWVNLTQDNHSGFNFIPEIQTELVQENKEMISTSLILDGTLIIDGNLTILDL